MQQVHLPRQKDSSLQEAGPGEQAFQIQQLALGGWRIRVKGTMRNPSATKWDILKDM